MREEIQKFHLNTLAMYQKSMYSTLLYPHHIITEIPSVFIFYNADEEPYKSMRGYLAVRDAEIRKIKYFIDEKVIPRLPIRINQSEEIFLKETSSKKQILQLPVSTTPFKIVPKQTFYSFKTFLDMFCSFEHTNPNEFFILKICAIMGYVGKTYLGISSSAEFGKSAVYEVIHSLTQKSPVFQPRSIPGVLIQLTGDGNIVFDEAHQSNTEVKRCMENITLQVAGNKPVYINGAIKSNMTKTRYDVVHQSITFLYNLYNYYKNPEIEFFDNFFSDNLAIDSRILKLKLEGRLLEIFDKNFDVVKTAEDNKLFYVSIAKYLLWLQQLKIKNEYKRRYTQRNRCALMGRKKIIYDELSWAIDMYADTDKEYQKFMDILDSCIIKYKDMLIETSFKNAEQRTETKFDKGLLQWTHCSVPNCQEVECNMGDDNKPYCQAHWNNGIGA